MGGGAYSTTDSARRSNFYDGKSTNEIFQQRSINNAMSPFNLRIRESRDSIEHPDSIAIILALDVTGSMGSIPDHLVKEGLNTLMGKILDNGVQDPQVLFLGIGDHECDSAPLQVAQFESSDELLDKWLKDVYLECGGGRNGGESYLLAWYLAAYHTSIDCFEKRKRKGYLFTIGDEPTLREIPRDKLKSLMGDGQYENFSAQVLLGKAREKYNVFHFHVRETSSGSRKDVMDGWKQIMQDDCIIVDSYRDIPGEIAKKIVNEKTHAIVDNISAEDIL